MWNSTKGIFVIIEPGTPEGFSHILQARKILLEQGANVVAPCTHNGECSISKDDWCSFYTRVARSKMQKQAKNGELGYEDEKFSYIAFSRTPINQNGAVILRHPQINSGYVKVKLCSKNGIEEKTFSKKDKELYKKVKKMDAGDAI
jgi:ribosomal protein RSM22 (predicted rRNA methylase)